MATLHCARHQTKIIKTPNTAAEKQLKIQHVYLVMKSREIEL